MKKIVMMLFMQMAALTLFAQLTLQGKVTGAGGEPLPGASVVLEGTYYGISTESDGSFSFTRISPGKYALVVSFVGYESHRQVVSTGSDAAAGEPAGDIEIRLIPKVIYTEEVMVQASRAKEKTPIAFSDLSGESLQSRNMGQDLPFLLAQTPSVVATSDAGNGIGYTSFRVRGADMNRMNVTVNGIPLNDAESHTTFFVDQPDLASSAEAIQIQRGAGTSTNGAAAFGASVNLQTLALQPDAYARIISSAGSFHTFRNTLALGTGLLGNHFSFDARLSGIRSDGFIDRSFSNLKSYYLSGGWYSAHTVVRAVAFTGWEKTYQAWNGVPSVRLHNDLAGMKGYGEHGLYSADETAHLIASDPRTYNLYTYENQVDLYQQDNVQLHLTHRFSSSLHGHAALHHTHGEGYYEQFRARDKFTNYALPNPEVHGTVITRTDLVRRKWLDNDFMGGIFTLSYSHGNGDLTWGGGYNHYRGNHFGRIIWAQYLGSVAPDHEWYRNQGDKKDLNSYVRGSYEVVYGLRIYGDAQFRHIRYSIDGIDDDLRNLDQQHTYDFFNPKAGIHYQPNSRNGLYFSFARTHREPNRDNFTDTPPGAPLPDAEQLNDLEAGWNYRSSGFMAGVNLYHMFYHNQLVLTGLINDVGAPVMTNVEKSHRSGVELVWGVKATPALRWDGNATLSRNRIREFTEYVDDWDNGGQQALPLGTTHLAFSPGIIANSQLTWQPGDFIFHLISAYTGRQYIDNTASKERALVPWLVNHLKAAYSPKSRTFKKLTFHLQVNNLLNEEYESNAWAYSYILGGKRYTMDGYFPQAGRHFMAGIDIAF